MPYPYFIKIEYTNQKGEREQSFEVDGSHDFLLENAMDPTHRRVFVECTGPVSDAPKSTIIFKLRPPKTGV